jgi:GT2 family glycosyltransferase
MQASVLIPTCRRPDQLGVTLAALAAQHDPPDFEVIVGVDGGLDGPPTDHLPPNINDLARTLGPRLRVERLPRVGYIAVRHRLLSLARGRWFVSLNDDAAPDPALLRTHAAHHAAHHESAAAPRIVAGAARWKPVPSPTLFDRLVQETGLIFFPPPPDRPLTYRDVYGLNMSAPVALALQHGGFPDLRDVYGYDDIELAHRLVTRAGATIVREPAALVTHDHRYTPIDVLRREHQLGRSAWAYAELNPAFARDLFGRDIRDRAELEHIAAALERDRRDAHRVQQRFLALAELPPDAARDELLPALADSWVLLKRYLWRRGLLAASRGDNEPFTLIES